MTGGRLQTRGDAKRLCDKIKARLSPGEGGGGVRLEHNKTQISTLKKKEGKARGRGRQGQKEVHTWLIRRTALEPDKDMNVSFLTLTSSLSSVGTRSDTRRHKSGINVVVGAREARYVRELLMMLAWLEEGSRGSDWYSSFMVGHEEGLMSSSRAHPESLYGDLL